MTRLRAPTTRWQMQADRRRIKDNIIRMLAIVNANIQTPSYGDEELIAPTMSMRTAYHSTRNVICIKHASALERQVTLKFKNVQGTAIIDEAGDIMENGTGRTDFLHAAYFTIPA